MAVTRQDSPPPAQKAPDGDGGGIYNQCGTLNGAVPGTGGNVFGTHPDDIVNIC